MPLEKMQDATGERLCCTEVSAVGQEMAGKSNTNSSARRGLNSRLIRGWANSNRSLKKSKYLRSKL